MRTNIWVDPSKILTYRDITLEDWCQALANFNTLIQESFELNLPLACPNNIWHILLALLRIPFSENFLDAPKGLGRCLPESSLHQRVKTNTFQEDIFSPC